MSELTRRSFLTALLAAGFCFPGAENNASALEDLDAIGRTLKTEPLIFDVLPYGGELVASNYLPNADRYTAYDVSPEDLQFGEGTYDLLDRIQALQDAIYTYAFDITDDAEALEDWGTDMAADFVDALPGDKRADLTRYLQRWFEGAPDFEERDSNDIVRPTDGRQMAFRLFWDFDPEILDALEIYVVEGDSPGSTYYAAEMRGDVDEANRIARELGMPWHFRRQ
ncbi:hypothetical protein SuNHUV7_09510 (plasmid) [Pseudoseohaeicola sp. NH-UV-7]|uniref:hypothetical protein n=1 Tax=Sulfitobacter sp. TBRI5 TaxID=2989732 RepID=UPI003A6653C2